MHSVYGDHRRKYLTLHGVEVCTIAWYLIHGIPKSTFIATCRDITKGSYQQRMETGATSDRGLEQFRSWVLLRLL